MALRGTLTHRKTRRLARLLGGIPLCYALGILEGLWHLTAEQRPQGDIGVLTNQDIAEELFYEGSADELIAALIDSGWLDVAECRLYVHGWHEHADGYVHASLAKKTLLFANGSIPRVTHDSFNADVRARIRAEYAKAYPNLKEGTNPEESRTSPGQVRSIPVPVPDPVPVPVPENPPPTGSPRPSAVFDAVWDEFDSVYPKRSGAANKAKGKDKIRAFLRSGVEAEAILAGARRYRAWADFTGKTGTELVAQMTTWLNGRRWEEEFSLPASPNGRHPPGEEKGPLPKQGEDFEFVDGGEGLVPVCVGSGEPFDFSRWFDDRGMKMPRNGQKWN